MKNISMLINTADKRSHINPEIYGHFSEHLGRCIYNGMYVGENSEIPNIKGVRKDVIEAFKEIKMPVLRWPGGCFADEYHWKDGIGEKSQRKKMINTNWGGVTEDNSFGTNEFFDLCEEIGCEPYLAGNLGSGTVQELAEWIEYITFDGVSPMADLRRKNGREKPWNLKYLGIGNENWGCGGSMRPEYYCDEYRRYQSFCKNFSGNELYKIACGPNSNDYNWTDVVMSNLGEWHTKAISLHYYTVPTGDWNKKGSATEFSDEEYYETISKTLYMDELIKRHSEIMSRRDPEGKIGLIVDEWGCWYDVEPFGGNHSGQVFVEDQLFDLFKTHQGGELCYSYANNCQAGGKIPMISQSASVKDGVLTVTIANCSIDDDAHICCDIAGENYQNIECRILDNEVRDYNDFDNCDKVAPKEYSAKMTEKGFEIDLPKCSVAVVTMR